MNRERALVQLPNGDLWRGYERTAKTEDNVAMPADAPRPFAKIDEAMSNIQIAAKGNSTLTCTWCGLQGDGKQMREHLKTSHPSIVQPPTDEQLAVAASINQTLKTK